MLCLISTITFYRNYCLQHVLNFATKYGDTCPYFNKEDAKRELENGECAFW